MREQTDRSRTRHSFFSRQQERALRSAEEAGRWLTTKRSASPPVDLAAAFYERDRDAFGWVLGSAVAFRMFLFLVPLTLLLLGGLTILVGERMVSEQVIGEAGITGAMAVEVQEALTGSQTTGWLLTISGVFGTIWAGRSLAKVLAAVSVGAWHLRGQAARASVRLIAAVIGFFAVILVLGVLVARLREASGVGHAASTVTVLVVYGALWFALCLTLPRGTRDPGALIPGAVLVGLVMAGLQALTQLLLVARIDSRSEVLGSLGAVAVVLGWLFFIGRVMVGSHVVNAVIFERYGSVSGLVFALPGLRRVPARYPSVRRFFDLDAADGEPERQGGNDDSAEETHSGEGEGEGDSGVVPTS